MDDIEEVTYSQGEPYQPHDRSWESDDDTEHDKRLHSQTDAKYNGYEQEHLSRSRQLKNNSRCLKSTSSHQVPSVMDDIEEVIYSQGEPYPDELHENKSWDSDDNSTSDITCSGWTLHITIKYHC